MNVYSDEYIEKDVVTHYSDLNTIKRGNVSLTVDYTKIDKWFNTDTCTEEEKVLKNILEIISKTDTITQAIEVTGIPRRAFYNLYKEAKTKFIQECT